MQYFTKATSALLRSGKRRLVTATVVVPDEGKPILNVHSWATGTDITKDLAEAERQHLIQELLGQTQK